MFLLYNSAALAASEVNKLYYYRNFIIIANATKFTADASKTSHQRVQTSHGSVNGFLPTSVYNFGRLV